MIAIRPRRLRRTDVVRSLVRENRVHVDQLIAPIFVAERAEDAGPIASMPGVDRLTREATVREARELYELGIKSVLLFGIPAHKDARASSNYDPQGIVPQTIRALKAALPEMVIVADLCNCEYTDHGHCGILDAHGDVDNDATVALLVRTAAVYAEAGVDVVAPSDMMDGRVGAIRSALDARAFAGVAIMSYSAKYASAFYGPFREAAGATPQFGDRRSYQMDPSNAREALREIALDVEEGADIVMVKPGLPYLDVVRAARDNFDVPIAVYNVSGEYAMLKAAIAQGWIDGDRAVDEVLTSFVRAGADIVITYFAKEYARRHG
ncbi:MAG: porphobilinogen synthase [Candidatus Eremiobacteraeota bacterium]|nr:porphobilinogen synthase [Candidatus Eremiobacteraeota bacterium]MBV8285271.1 porphobilinogen synthase [Candidatus Eremiobacteraeota bacterium]MBV8435107.1 porphobilinogen synthase [Candidatus Eremiobacteraeota bacterium]MBV8582657.1 porphobilinogen synthase [Candidatus Eremiobacteraeota bacterium]MBV8655230.1 porphobilinogen synthase [Candidatus Eremiobacteraeota bacterium]